MFMDDGESDDGIPDETEEALDSGELSQPNTWWMRALTGPPARQQHHAPLPPFPPESPTVYRPLPPPSTPTHMPLTRRLRHRNEYEWVQSSETPPLHVGAEALLYVTAAYMTRELCVIANHQLYIEDYRVFAGSPGHVLVRVTGRERGLPVELLLEMPREI